MKRLTSKNEFNKNIISTRDEWGYTNVGCRLTLWGVIADKLFAYEDTGITPEEVEELKAFKAYFDDMYGKGLEVANWHLNGDLEPFDNFYENAIDERSKEKA